LISTKKEKRTKKERKVRKGRSVETATAVEIRAKVAFGDIFLMDFHRCLKKPAGFFTVPTDPATINLIRDQLS